MDCIYNSGALCYKDNENITVCPYTGNESDCEDSEVG